MKTLVGPIWFSLLCGVAGSSAAPILAEDKAGVVQSSVAKPEDGLLGEWWTENNEGRIRFTRDREGFIRGTTTCCTRKVASDAHPLTDIHNPNPQLRSRSTIGIVIIWKLSYEDGEFSGGYVYSPRDGKTYRIKATIIDKDTIRIRGYAGITLFGQNQVWKRYVP